MIAPSKYLPAKPSVNFTLEDVNRADWTFNCGPGALCAILGKTPEELKPTMAAVGFMEKGYSNPTLVNDVLRLLRVPFRQVYRSDHPHGMPICDWALVRIQWGGPWTKPGVPMAARYRQTHWVAAAQKSAWIFDINAMCVGGWLTEAEWALQLVPWLIKECCPKGDGTFWPTHALEVNHG